MNLADQGKMIRAGIDDFIY